MSIFIAKLFPSDEKVPRKLSSTKTIARLFLTDEKIPRLFSSNKNNYFKLFLDKKTC